MPLRPDLLKPISEDHPSGADLRYDPVIDKIKEARREDIDAPQGAWKTTVKAAEYGQVIKLAGEVLATRSKDLQVAVWLVEAHIRREGLAIVADCFRFIRDLIEQFWDTLYPAAEDGDLELRAGPLEWLGSKLDVPIRLAPVTASGLSYLAFKESRLVGYEADAADSYERQTQRSARIGEGKFSAEQFDEAVEATPVAFYEATLGGVRAALTMVQSLADVCDERFGKDSPGFTNVRRALEDVEGVLEQLARKRGASTQIAANSEAGPEHEGVVDEFSVSFDSAPASATRGGFELEDLVEGSGVGVAVADAERARNGFVQAGPLDEEDVTHQLLAISRFLRSADRNDAAAFLILRAYRWGKLRSQYDATSLPAPPSELRVQLKALYRSEDWSALLEKAEDAVALPCGGPWLDVHRYSARALEELGADAAALAVRTGLRGLLQDLPDLLDAALVDDSLAASAETAEWMRSAVLSAGATDSMASEASVDSAEEPVAEEDAPPVELDFSTRSDDGGEEATATSGESSEAQTEQPLPEAPFELTLDDEVTESKDQEVFAQALAAAKEGNAKDGLKMLSQELAREQTNRGRFRRRTQLAHLLMSLGHEKVAAPLLEQLRCEIEERSLGDWEDGPAIAYPLELLFRCVGEGDEEKRAQLFARICQLDPARAVTLS